MFRRPWVSLLPALGLSVAWWVVATRVFGARGGMSQAEVRVLLFVVGLQVISLVVSFAACLRARASGWASGLLLGVILLAGNALYFFTPALGAPLLLAAIVGACVVLFTSRAEPGTGLGI